MKLGLFDLKITAAAVVFSLGLFSDAQAGHPPAECQDYANKAIEQLAALTAAGCAGKPGVQMWSGDYNQHYDYCVSQDGDLGHEFKKRRLAIEACQQHSEAECRKYANNAVGQTRIAVRNSCPGISPPLWGENFQTHYDWCRSDVSSDLGRQFEQRRIKLDDCSSTHTGGLSRPTKLLLCTDLYCTNCTGSNQLCELDNIACPNVNASWACFQ